MSGIHDLSLLILSGLLLNIIPGPDSLLIMARSTAPGCVSLALFTALVSARLKVNPAPSLWLNRATGGLFIWLGIKLALSKQS